MARWYVSVDHRLIGGTVVYTTSSTVEAPTSDEAIADLVRYAVRQGHEVRSVHASIEDAKGE